MSTRQNVKPAFPPWVKDIKWIIGAIVTVLVYYFVDEVLEEKRLTKLETRMDNMEEIFSRDVKSIKENTDEIVDKIRHGNYQP